ncbi:vancomycin high temperature exclusion protein [Spongiactinospora sp. 9N601]|uniref:vancomycin high temperature exclusion protein n=1 Tax=Spongiactinospora sp. 9N601 TaxID=3375149 RepID=UPI00379C657B
MPSRRPSRPVLRRAFQATVLLSVLGLAPFTWAWLTSSGHRTVAGLRPGWEQGVPAAPVALVLGAAVRYGEPTPMLARRLDIAAALHRAGRVRALLLSGAGHGPGYDEPAVMRAYLLDRGVPGEAIVSDPAGYDTWDSCVRARKVFGADRVIVVSQVFHLPRAVTLCRMAGLEPFGVGDDSSVTWPAATYGYALREFPASVKAFFDAVVLRSRPRLTGPPQTSLREALARP